MNVTKLSFFTRSLQNSKYLIIGIGIGVIGLHFELLWQIAAKFDQVSLRLLFLGALLSLLWEKRHIAKLGSDPASTFVGLFLITLVLVESRSIHKTSEVLLDILLMLSALGFGLLAVGARRLKQYWRESLIVFLMALPTFALGLLLDKYNYFSITTAKFSTFLIWYLGFEVFRKGVDVLLPFGGITVTSFCSGVTPILTLLQLALLFLLMFPTKPKDKLLLPIVSVTLAFIVNVVRVVLLALLANPSNSTAFDYWHNGDGSQIFSLISMVTFGYYCKFVIYRNKSGVEV